MLAIAPHIQTELDRVVCDQPGYHHWFYTIESLDAALGRFEVGVLKNGIAQHTNGQHTPLPIKRRAPLPSYRLQQRSLACVRRMRPRHWFGECIPATPRRVALQGSGVLALNTGDRVQLTLLHTADQHIVSRSTFLCRPID